MAQLFEPDPQRPGLLRPVASHGPSSDPSDRPPPSAAPAAAGATRQRPPSLLFLLSHPAHAIALGFGAGLARRAPGTIGTLWAWALFAIFSPWLSDRHWAILLATSLLVGWWACTLTARHLGQADPSAIVWDEILAFWIVLWLLHPSSLWTQTAAFALFRFFDALKPGPVAWADQRFKGFGPRGGFGILLDDLAAALCTLLLLAWWRF